MAEIIEGQSKELPEDYDPLLQPGFWEHFAEGAKDISLPIDLDPATLWDTLTHCNEPPGNDVILAALGAPEEKLDAEDFQITQEEHKHGRYRVNIDHEGKPFPHITWDKDFKLVIEQDGRSFYVLRSEREEPPTDDDDILIPKYMAPGSSALLCDFGSRYYSMAPDTGSLSGGKSDSEIKFSFAEHRKMGESLTLTWENGEKTDGTREIKLQNGVSLNYGEINGFGGDFFGGYNPICTGKDLSQQCKYFEDAFNSMAVADTAPKEVEALRENRKEEVELIYKAAREGKPTFDAYKSLVRKGKSYLLTQEDEQLTMITLRGKDKPSYLRLAQLNLDHFGEDAKTAYKAGHYCALKKAAEGDLKTAYAMNAFSDHYLGDCFAAGHIRTPRRQLHGNPAAALDALQNIMSLTSIVKIAEVVPDLCVMAMHNEDNYLGLTVKNPLGEEWVVYGDKKLYQSGNNRNADIMQTSLQASVDEVYAAWKSKRAKTPNEGYNALKYAPSEVVKHKSHKPLFQAYKEPERSFWDPRRIVEKFRWEVEVRDDIDDPQCDKRTAIGNIASVVTKFIEIKRSNYHSKF